MAADLDKLFAPEDAAAATARLIAIARSDTGQAARVADFLLAWWNGDDNGHFPIHHLASVDDVIARDILTILWRIASEPAMIYADAFGQGPAMEELWHQWRGPFEDEPLADEQ